jgi:hypothetical protein
MARGSSAEDDAVLGSLGSPQNHASGHSTRDRLLKVGLHNPGQRSSGSEGLRIVGADREEGESALAAWKKYKGA